MQLHVALYATIVWVMGSLMEPLIISILIFSPEGLYMQN